MACERDEEVVSLLSMVTESRVRRSLASFGDSRSERPSWESAFASCFSRVVASLSCSSGFGSSAWTS